MCVCVSYVCTCDHGVDSVAAAPAQLRLTCKHACKKTYEQEQFLTCPAFFLTHLTYIHTYMHTNIHKNTHAPETFLTCWSLTHMRTHTYTHT